MSLKTIVNRTNYLNNLKYGMSMIPLYYSDDKGNKVKQQSKSTVKQLSKEYKEFTVYYLDSEFELCSCKGEIISPVNKFLTMRDIKIPITNVVRIEPIYM